jgi:hypothetical protein
MRDASDILSREGNDPRISQQASKSAPHTHDFPPTLQRRQNGTADYAIQSRRIPPTRRDCNAHVITPGLRALPLADQPDHFTRLGVPSQALLGEYELAINRHFKQTTARFD